MELVARNGMAIAGSFFHKWGSHKIASRSGQHRMELDLLGMRKQQLWRMKDYKAMAGEHATTQHKPVVFVVHVHKRRQVESRGQKMLILRKCRDNVAVEDEGKV